MDMEYDASRTEPIDLAEPEAEADHRLQDALRKYRDGDLPTAEQLLLNLLLADPGNVGARFGLAMCRLDRGDAAIAAGDFTAVLNRDPRHHDAAYHLGRAFESLGKWEQASTAYQLASALGGHPGARAAVQRCQSRLMQDQRQVGDLASGQHDGAGVTVTGVPNGPPPVRSIIEKTQRAERGKPRMRVHRQARYGLPSVIKALIAMAVVHYLPSIMTAVLQPVLSAEGFRDSAFQANYYVAGATDGALPGVTPLWSLLQALTWLYLALILAMLPVRSFMYTTDLYEHGMDTRTGVFRRRGQFIWYYQITEPPTYLRNVTSYLTHTASLRVSYNNTASTTEKTELPGIGTPRQVEELRSYLESRIPPERLVIRGPWT